MMVLGNDILMLCLSLGVLILLRISTVLAIDPIPHVTHSGETITVAAGQYFGLECQVENGAKSKVKWEICRQLNNAGRCIRFSGLTSKIKTKYHMDYGVKREGRATYFLYIYDIKPEQSGTYHCTVRNARYAMRVTDFVHVQVYAKPTIDYLQTTADLTVRAGLPVTLSCVARGSPEPSVIWQKVGGTMIPGIGMNNPNSTMVIPSCTQEARGQYSCIATNHYGQTHHTINVDCQGAPRIKATPVIQHQMVGYQSKMTCVVESSPSVTRVWWRKDDQVILPESDRRYEIVTMKAALGRVITKLVIKSGVTEEDFRCSYSCHARNVFGTANTTLHIEESHTPQPYDGCRVLKANTATPSSQSLSHLTLVLIAMVTVILAGTHNS